MVVASTVLRRMVVASMVTCTQLSGVAVPASGTAMLGRGCSHGCHVPCCRASAFIIAVVAVLVDMLAAIAAASAEVNPTMVAADASAKPQLSLWSHCCRCGCIAVATAVVVIAAAKNVVAVPVEAAAMPATTVTMIIAVTAATIEASRPWAATESCPPARSRYHACRAGHDHHSACYGHGRAGNRRPHLRPCPQVLVVPATQLPPL